MIKNIILVFFLLVAGAFLGEAWIHPSDPLFWEILWKARWAQLLASFAVGSILALSGLIFQQLFANRLATPFTLGVSSWSAFGACLGLLIGASFGELWCSMLFTILGIGFLYIFSKLQSFYLLLAGVGLQMLAGSGILFLQYFSYQSDLEQMVKWLVGSISFWGMNFPAALFAFSVFSYFFLQKYKYELFALSVGEDWAALHGIPVAKMKRFYLLSVSLIVGIVVSFVGPIGFIGLVVPHVAGARYPQQFSKQWFYTWFWGGVALAACLILAKQLSYKGVFPVGIVVTLLGTPYYLWILVKQSRIQFHS